MTETRDPKQRAEGVNEYLQSRTEENEIRFDTVFWVLKLF